MVDYLVALSKFGIGLDVEVELNHFNSYNLIFLSYYRLYYKI
jgi:hypothetical protein